MAVINRLTHTEFSRKELKTLRAQAKQTDRFSTAPDEDTRLTLLWGDNCCRNAERISEELNTRLARVYDRRRQLVNRFYEREQQLAGRTAALADARERTLCALKQMEGEIASYTLAKDRVDEGLFQLRDGIDDLRMGRVPASMLGDAISGFLDGIGMVQSESMPYVYGLESNSSYVPLTGQDRIDMLGVLDSLRPAGAQPASAAVQTAPAPTVAQSASSPAAVQDTPIAPQVTPAPAPAPAPSPAETDSLTATLEALLGKKKD